MSATPAKISFHLDDLADIPLPEGAVAVDTETMGLNPHRDRLCLVQLGFVDGSCHLVQIKKNAAPTPQLKKLLEDPHRIKIFHFARFDVAALQKYLGINVTPLVCTKIASKLCRTYTDRHSLKELCKELLGVDLAKTQQTSDWGAAELTADQQQYAAQDVLYLHQLWAKLKTQLERENRLELATACYDFMNARARLDLYGWDEPDIFAH
ncbi:MAG: ribonuclease D [Alphaproteobacteria bacterium]